MRFAVLQQFDYVFSENGLVAYKAGELLAVQVGRGSGRPLPHSDRPAASDSPVARPAGWLLKGCSTAACCAEGAGLCLRPENGLQLQQRCCAEGLC